MKKSPNDFLLKIVDFGLSFELANPRTIRKALKEQGLRKSTAMAVENVSANALIHAVTRQSGQFKSENLLAFALDPANADSETSAALWQHATNPTSSHQILQSSHLATAKFRTSGSRNLEMPSSMGVGPRAPRTLTANFKGSNSTAMVHKDKLNDIHMRIRPLSLVVGTVHYVSPEMLNGAYALKHDIWAAGVLLYYTTYGAFPYPGNSDFEVWGQIMKNMQPKYE